MMLLGGSRVEAEDYCKLLGWGWSSNTGWISFSSENCDSDGDGVTDTGNYGQCPAGQSVPSYEVIMDPYTGDLSGYAWSSNLGWLSFDDYAGCPASPCAPQVTGGFPDCTSGCSFEGFSRFLAGSPAAAGWRGWVRLSDTFYNLEAVEGTNYLWDVSGWAWGGGDGYSKGVHGWTSGNCAEQGSCDASDYKIILSCEGFNFPPVIEGTYVYEHDCCETPRPLVTLGWVYKDWDGDEQYARYVKIYSGGSLIEEDYLEDTSATTYDPKNLDWDTSYTWEIKVWDERGGEIGAESGWYDGRPFTTGSGSIYPDFSWEPEGPVIGEQVQFTDESHTVGNILVIQNPDESGLYNWSWQFEEGVPATSSEQNPLVQFGAISPGGNEVSITVHYSGGGFELSCTKTKTVNVLLELPEWIEVSPGG